MDILKPRGTRDFLPEELNRRKYVENTLRKVFETYGYSEIKTPIFEELSLFTMKSGEGIKEQIYHFQDKGGRDLALRPELTAPVARVYLNELQKTSKPLKMYYSGSCFRYERPQAGRYRQFWQFGCELIGGKPPEAEAEIITMAAHCLEELGLNDYEFHIGNLGIIRGILNDARIIGEEQEQIMSTIDKGDVSGLKTLMKSLNIPEAVRSVLISLIGIKGHKEVINEVESIVGSCKEAFKALENLEELLKVLDAFEFFNYIVNLGIARGLDYYSGMVFEIYVHGLGAQKQISGGGTYNLIEAFGGEEVESTGFAFGFDRLMKALEKQNIEFPSLSRTDVFVAPLSSDMREKAFKIAQNLRRNHISADVDLARRKLKKTLSYADNLGSKYVILVGKRDFKQGMITLKDMKSGNQEPVDINDIDKKLAGLISTKR
ncbi:MAG: histidine--tRNA ligase [Euryarchaeota archaeon]|nr:histidine--tRNA ligase [Euryarchaeota archaeon]